jgi:hypothetical protein
MGIITPHTFLDIYFSDGITCDINGLPVEPLAIFLR